MPWSRTEGLKTMRKNVRINITKSHLKVSGRNLQIKVSLGALPIKVLQIHAVSFVGIPMFGKCLGTFMFHMQQMKTRQGWVVVVFMYDQSCQKVGRNGNCQSNCLQKIHVLHPWRLTWNTKMEVDGRLFSWFLGSVLIFQGVKWQGIVSWSL